MPTFDFDLDRTHRRSESARSSSDLSATAKEFVPTFGTFHDRPFIQPVAASDDAWERQSLKSASLPSLSSPVLTRSLSYDFGLGASYPGFSTTFTPAPTAPTPAPTPIHAGSHNPHNPHNPTMQDLQSAQLQLQSLLSFQIPSSPVSVAELSVLVNQLTVAVSPYSPTPYSPTPYSHTCVDAPLPPSPTAVPTMQSSPFGVQQQSPASHSQSRPSLGIDVGLSISPADEDLCAAALRESAQFEEDVFKNSFYNSPSSPPTPTTMSAPSLELCIWDNLRDNQYPQRSLSPSVKQQQALPAPSMQQHTNTTTFQKLRPSASRMNFCSKMSLNTIRESHPVAQEVIEVMSSRGSDCDSGSDDSW